MLNGCVPSLARKPAAILAVTAMAAMLASCGTAPTPNEHAHFSEAEYGVRASPRVVGSYQPAPKGGGYYMVGKPYRVAGKTYIPRDNPNYTAVGLASWYGSEFHGRRTANGEVYDAGELTAAHPTLPLPSYVRVTNLGNGRSVIVRVNDRGPFARNRVIDVSQTTAELLDFRRIGTARVKVEYVGPARMDGQDRNLLLASYRDGGQPPGQMIAVNAPQPPPVVVASAAKPRRTIVDFATAPDQPMALVPMPAALTTGDPLGPLILRTGVASSYLPTSHFSRAQEAAETLAASGTTAAQALTAVDNSGKAVASGPVVQIGTFADPARAKLIAARFVHFGAVTLIDRISEGQTLRIVRVVATRAPPDAVIAAADAAGLSGAFVVSR